MSTIRAFLNSTDKLRTALFWYWLISPFLFLLYAFMISANAGTDFRQLLNEPTIAIAFLLACLTLIMVGLFKVVYTENQRSQKIFGIFATLQQLLVGNFLGFLLAYFYTRSLWLAPAEKFAPKNRALLLAGMVFIGLFSLFILMIALIRFLNS